MISRVFIAEVKTSKEKLKVIFDLCQTHFDNRQKIVIKTESKEASLYLDDFLWKSSPESFLPHGIDSNELISITHEEGNPNQATICLNLTKNPLIGAPFSKIYELDDKTSVEKARLSEFRFQMYKKSAIPVASY